MGRAAMRKEDAEDGLEERGVECEGNVDQAELPFLFGWVVS